MPKRMRLWNAFIASKNWEAGVDGNIAVIAAGDGGTASNITTKEPITAVVFDVKGLFFDDTRTLYVYGLTK